MWSVLVGGWWIVMCGCWLWFGRVEAGVVGLGVGLASPGVFCGGGAARDAVAQVGAVERTRLNAAIRSGVHGQSSARRSLVARPDLTMMPATWSRQ